MSKKTTTNSTIQYNPTGMTAYNSLVPQFQNTVQQFMQDPLSSTYFNQNLGLQSKFLNQQGVARQQNITGNQAALGMGGRMLSGYAAGQSAAASRGTTGQVSNAFTGLLNNATAARQWAAGQAGAFRPLETGQNTVQTQSGLGTWLPQLAGAAIGGAMNAFMPRDGAAKGATGGSSSAGWLNSASPSAMFASSMGLPSNMSPFTMGTSGMGTTNAYNLGF